MRLSGSPVVPLKVLFPFGFLAQRRAVERRADVLAAQTMVCAGFDPNAPVRYVERVQDKPAPDSAKSSPLPLPEERVADMEIGRHEAASRPLPNRSTLLFRGPTWAVILQGNDSVAFGVLAFAWPGHGILSIAAAMAAGSSLLATEGIVGNFAGIMTFQTNAEVYPGDVWLMLSGVAPGLLWLDAALTPPNRGA